MPCLCDKCGAPTRWYDEKCPCCGATRAVEIPTAAIALPNWAPASPRRDDAPVEPPFSSTEPTETPQDTRERQTEPTETPQDTRPPQTELTETPQDTRSPRTETPPRRERSQRLLAFRRDVDAWRSAFSPETASVTLPRGRVVRYALGIVAELFVCFPCAFLAAYFFTRALRADRRARYHEAMLETEKARRTLAVGIGVFAALLCAFVFYVQSQEVAAPKDSGPTSLLFKK
ncbi:MAG: hypothetical protein IJ991_03025 [Thermoguttaceae bacterium]|nr:hypothetical protein [Thermoguttaceae bacterium]